MRNKIILCIIILLGVGCTDYLDPKPNDNMVVPTSLEDVRSLLDNVNVFNKQPVLNIHSGDEFFITEVGLDGMSNSEQGSYRWEIDPYQGERIGDWSVPYEQIFYSNIALKALNEMGEQVGSEYRKLIGEALFHRAHAYFQLLQQFSPAYQEEGGNEQLLGVVIKDSPDVNEKAVRSDLEFCYQLVLSDLKLAVDMLPALQLPKTRPSKSIALGLLARVYLVTFDYNLAADAAIKALELYKERFDFNELDVSQSRPFLKFGKETVFYSELVSLWISSSPEVFLDTALAKKYAEGDLRFSAYFDEVGPNRYLYRGRLTGDFAMFGGLSVGELELIAAESLTRTGKETEAILLLNKFLSRRMIPEKFVEVSESGEDLLKLILDEREKELVGRGTRWSDLRRLNQDPRFVRTIKRVVDGKEVELEPNSLRYTFPIPQEEIMLTGIQQNAR